MFNNQNRRSNQNLQRSNNKQIRNRYLSNRQIQSRQNNQRRQQSQNNQRRQQQPQNILFFSDKSKYSMDFLNKLNMNSLTKYFKIVDINNPSFIKPSYLTKIPTIIISSQNGKQKLEGTQAFNWLKSKTSSGSNPKKQQINTSDVAKKTQIVCNEDPYNCGILANTQMDNFSSVNLKNDDLKTNNVSRGFGQKFNPYGYEQKIKTQNSGSNTDPNKSSQSDMERYKMARDNDPSIRQQIHRS